MATETLTFTWPTQRTDGTPGALTDIASAEIHDVSTVDPSDQIIGSITPSTPGATFTTGPLTIGFHNFTVIVVGVDGTRSEPSNKFTQEVTGPATVAFKAVTDLAGVLNP